MLDISFALPALPKSGALVLLAEDGGEPDAIRLAADEATAGGVSRALEAAEFKPRPGKTCTILAPGAGLSRIVVAGIGKLAELTPRTAEEAGGAIAAALARESEASLAASGLTAGAGRRPRRRGRACGATGSTATAPPRSPRTSPKFARLAVLAADPARARRGLGGRCAPWSRASTSPATWSASRPTC